MINTDNKSATLFLLTITHSLIIVYKVFNEKMGLLLEVGYKRFPKLYKNDTY